MSKSFQISGAEWDVMEVVWEAGACAAADVISKLSGTHDWNHRTIRTLLARLVEKGALAYEVAGSRYTYRPAVTRKQCLRQEGRSFVDKVFGGDVAALLTHFVSDSALKPEELEQLRDLLDQKQSGKRKST